jgi:hypothetical protein
VGAVDTSRYAALGKPFDPKSSNGAYYDREDGDIVLIQDGEVVFRWNAPAGEVTAGLGASLAALLSGDITSDSSGVTAIGASKVLSAMLSPLLVRYVKVPVTSAEILAINATPKAVVAAPGAGYIVNVHKAVLVLNYGTVAYANNGILGLYETNASGTLLTGTLTLASFLAQTADTIKELHPTAASATTGLTRLDNKAVVLTQATGESITGDSPVDVHCWYSIVPHGL